MTKKENMAAAISEYQKAYRHEQRARRAAAREAYQHKEELETLRERVKLWIPVIEQLSRDYRHATGVSEIHPIHQDLIDDMKDMIE